MLYSGVSMLTLIPLPKVPSTLPLLELDLEDEELTLGDSLKTAVLETVELVARADWTAELIWGWRVAMIWAIRAFWSSEEEEEEELEDVLVLTGPAEDVDFLFLRELMETKPSCFSEVAENPMAPASYVKVTREPLGLT